MKKFIIKALTATMVFSLVGCNTVEESLKAEINPPVMKPVKEVEAETPINLRIGNIKFSPELKTLSYLLYNDGEDLIEYGLSYIIEKNEGDEWVDTEMTHNMAVIMILMMVEPGNPSEDGFSLSQFEFEEGQYRVVRQYRENERVYDGGISFNVDEDKEISLFESYVGLNKAIPMPNEDDLITLPVEPPVEESMDESNED